MTDLTRERLVELSRQIPAGCPIPEVVSAPWSPGSRVDWPSWALRLLCETEDCYSAARIVPSLRFDSAVPELVDEPETTPIPYERMTQVVAERRR